MKDDDIDLRGILSLLRRQFRLIALTVIIGILGAAIFVFSLTPIYTASTLIMVDPSNKNLLDPSAIGMTSSAENARIDSEVEIMRSDNILLKVISSQNLLVDREFGVSLSLRDRVLGFLRLATPSLPTGQEALNQSLSKLAGAVTVQRRGLTYLISLQVRSEDPAKAATLANATADVYIQDQLSSKVASILAARDILQARISEAREAIVQSEGSFDRFISDNLDRISQDSGRTDLVTMQSSIRQLTQAREANASRLAQAQGSLGTNNWSDLVSSLESEALSVLERQRDNLTRQLASGADSPAEIDLRAELEAIENQMRTTADQEIAALQDQVAEAQVNEETMRQRLRQQVLGSTLSADVLAQLYELQQSAELARAQYQTLLSRAQDLDAQANLQVADSRVVSEALTPRAPSFPNRTLMLALAALVSLGVGVGLAFLYENLIGGFTSEEQIESVLKTPVASGIPLTKLPMEGESLADLVVKAPLSVFSEAIRRVRTATDQRATLAIGNPEAQSSVVIMVTSTLPNEGKTTLALALARSYALSGQSTLLIDGDMRKPSIHRHLQVQPTVGFSDFLSQPETEAQLSSIVSRDTLTSATIIFGARRSGAPTDQLLAGPRFTRLLEAARRTFNVVVIDTPPIGPVTDGLYIAPHADIVVFNVRWASTGQREAGKAINALRSGLRPSAELIAVLNQQSGAGRNYLRKYSSYYQEYA